MPAVVRLFSKTTAFYATGTYVKIFSNSIPDADEDSGSSLDQIVAAGVMPDALCERISVMDEQKLAELLERYDDESLETLMGFVESLGSFEEARAAIDALDKLRKAA